MRYMYCSQCGCEIYDGDEYFEIPRIGKVCTSCASEALNINWVDEDEDEEEGEGGESDGDNKRSN